MAANAYAPENPPRLFLISWPGCPSSLGRRSTHQKYPLVCKGTSRAGLPLLSGRKMRYSRYSAHVIVCLPSLLELYGMEAPLVWLAPSLYMTRSPARVDKLPLAIVNLDDVPSMTTCVFWSAVNKPAYPSQTARPVASVDAGVEPLTVLVNSA
ncbi:hypothetical protein KCU61_g101, partial [Aureobasidium melanogenum]